MQAIIDNAYWIIIGLTIVVIALSYALYWKEKKIARIKNKAKAEITQAQNNCELEKQELLTKHRMEIDTLQRECERKVQLAKETIENRKYILGNMDEKSLLIEVMIALDGYSNRFERLESQLYSKQIIAVIDRLFQDISTQMNSTTESLKSRIDDMNASIEHSIPFSTLGGTIEDMSAEIDTLRSTIDGISSDTDSIRSDIGEIKTSVCDRYSYDSLASNLSAVMSAIDEVKDAVESARSAAECAKDAVESHF